MFEQTFSFPLNVGVREFVIVNTSKDSYKNENLRIGNYEKPFPFM